MIEPLRTKQVKQTKSSSFSPSINDVRTHYAISYSLFVPGPQSQTHNNLSNFLCIKVSRWRNINESFIRKTITHFLTFLNSSNMRFTQPVQKKKVKRAHTLGNMVVRRFTYKRSRGKQNKGI